MALKYYCDKCGTETDDDCEDIREDFCPKCAKEYHNWLKGKK